MKPYQIVLIIFMCALITFGLRALPFVIFHGNRKMPEKLQILGQILPAAIMAVLVVYCLKDISDGFEKTGIFQLIAALIVAVSYKLKHNTFLSIVLGTGCYMAMLYLL